MRPHARTFALAFASALLLAFTSSIAVLTAQEIEFVTQNDLFAGDRAADDLYTFAVALEVERNGTTFALREAAFTDRAAGLRFDETSWNIGRPLPDWRGWRAYAEVGALRVGRGIFGEQVQNTVHRAIGGDALTLEYLDPSLHGRLALSAERSWSTGRSLALGSRVDLEWVQAHASHAILAAQIAWQPLPVLAVDLMAGLRWGDADQPLLEPHLQALGGVFEVGLTLFDRVRVAWSSNDHGDGRDHLLLAYRFARLRSGADGAVRD
jgi:hypothetical protein